MLNTKVIQLQRLKSNKNDNFNNSRVVFSILFIERKVFCCFNFQRVQKLYFFTYHTFFLSLYILFVYSIYCFLFFFFL